MKNYQNPNLWGVKFAVRGLQSHDILLVCGADTKVAATKATRVLKKKKIRGAQLTEITSYGDIDAF